MVTRYPHYLHIDNTPEVTQDEHGDWVANDFESATKQISRCREETNGAGTRFNVGGGEYINASSVIQLPKDCPIITKGTKVYITNDPQGEDVRISGVCLRFDQSQLHSRLWL